MKVLVIVDMQNDFVTGPLGSPEAVNIIEPIRKRIDTYRNDPEHSSILYTKDTHGTDYLETQEGRNLPVTHCIKDTPGWEIVKELYLPDCQVIEKTTFGSFELAEVIAHLQSVESIEITGVCTDICVVSNALILKARFPEIPIFVHADCCAGVSKESHEKALDTMSMCQIRIL